MPVPHEPAGLAGLQGTTNHVNFKARVELRAVCKYWDKLKDEAAQQYKWVHSAKESISLALDRLTVSRPAA